MFTSKRRSLPAVLLVTAQETSYCKQGNSYSLSFGVTKELRPCLMPARSNSYSLFNIPK